MTRSLLSIVYIAGLLAGTAPGFADRLPPQASDQVQAAGQVNGQSASPAYSRASSPDAGAAVKPASGNDSTPCGFGWG